MRNIKFSMLNKNIKQAKTLPSEFYYSHSKFEDLKEKVFAKNWQFICDTSRLINEGDAVPYDFIKGYIEEPLLLINNNNEIQSFTNVCTHRGNILVEEPCNLKSGIICKYHGRQFNSCGKFKFMPMFKGVQDFPSKDDNLKQTYIKNIEELLTFKESKVQEYINSCSTTY